MRDLENFEKLWTSNFPSIHCPTPMLPSSTISFRCECFRGSPSRHRKKQLARTVADHEALISEILNTVQGVKLRKWLKKKLKYSNEVSLEERIREAWLHVPEKLRLVIGGADFSRRIARTRNGLTHHSGKGDSEVIDDVKELWLATQCMTLLIQIEFLRQMELSEQLLPTIVRRSHDFNNLASQISEDSGKFDIGK